MLHVLNNNRLSKLKQQKQPTHKRMEVRCVGLASMAGTGRVEQPTVKMETILEQRQHAVVASK